MSVGSCLTVPRRLIAPRLPSVTRKPFVNYDSKGEYSQQITSDQLDSLGLLGDQARGSTSPEADLIKVAKSRHDWVHWASSQCLTNFPVFWMKANVTIFSRLLICQNSAERKLKFAWGLLSLLSWSTQRHEIGFLGHRQQAGAASRSLPVHRTAMVVHVQNWKLFRRGMHRVPPKEPSLQPSFVQHGGGSDRSSWWWTTSQAHQRSESWFLQRKRRGEKTTVATCQREERGKAQKAEQTAAFGQGPSKKGTATPVAQTTPKVEADSSSTSAHAWLDDSQTASGDRQYTGQWVKWQGSWYQKVICYGRTDWEESWNASMVQMIVSAQSRILVFPSVCGSGPCRQGRMQSSRRGKLAVLPFRLTWGGCICTCPENTL